MSDLWENDPSEAWGIPIDLDTEYWQCDCSTDCFNPNENTHCFSCGKTAPAHIEANTPIRIGEEEK